MNRMYCNSCFDQSSENGGPSNQQQFHLTSCGHIFCVNCGCFADGTSDCCRICRSKCSSVFLGDNLFETDQKVLDYFRDPKEICEKLFKVMAFQKSQCILLETHHRQILSKYNRAKIYIKKLEHELKIAKNALSNTPEDLNCDSETLCAMPKPIFHPNSTPFKLIDAESKVQKMSSINKNIPDIKHRKQSFQNESSMSSLGSMGRSGSKTDSSAYSNKAI